MLDNLEALVALADCGTMRRAALKLHISQSAISKRIATLENLTKKKLIEPHGRLVQLTPTALRFLEKTRPLMIELKQLLLEEGSETSGSLEIDVSVSVLISEGAQMLAQVKKKMPRLELKVNAHHASISVERVRAGDSMLALVQGEASIAPDLMALPVLQEVIVLVPSHLKKFKLSKKGNIPIISMEPYTEASHFIERGIKDLKVQHGINLTIESTLQSFSAIAQMARAGFGHGLVPLDVALALGIKPAQLITFPNSLIKIPVSLIGRRSTLARPLVQRFYAHLVTKSK